MLFIFFSFVDLVFFINDIALWWNIRGNVTLEI